MKLKNICVCKMCHYNTTCPVKEAQQPSTETYKCLTQVNLLQLTTSEEYVTFFHRTEIVLAGSKTKKRVVTPQTFSHELLFEQSNIQQS